MAASVHDKSCDVEAYLTSGKEACRGRGYVSEGSSICAVEVLFYKRRDFNGASLHLHADLELSKKLERVDARHIERSRRIWDLYLSRSLRRRNLVRN